MHPYYARQFNRTKKSIEPEGIINNARTKIKLISVPVHQGIKNNKKADELARSGSEIEFFRPESALGISKSTVGSHISGLIVSKHHNYWVSMPGQVHGKTFVKGPLPEGKENYVRLLS